MKKLLVSFSGGETSAYLAKWLIDNKSDVYEMVFVFANTGDEEEETLIFVERCAKDWDINIVWVEAVVNPEYRKVTTHKIVDFKTASRNREPFIDVIKKYGIPNQNFIHCNREMKLRPIHSYMKSIGLDDYETAIGVRVDEFDRVSKDRIKNKLIYPLVTMRPTTKQEISNWWNNQSFRVNLKSYQTNCRTCWKKSDVVLAQIYKENPKYFDFNSEMEKTHGDDKYCFFRNGRNTEQLINDLVLINKKPRDKHIQYQYQQRLFTESCDVYSNCGD